MTGRWMRCSLIVLFITALAFGQADWYAQRKAYRDQAQAALTAETLREKAEECPGANTTRAEEDCLSSEIAKTEKNYATFVEAIHSMLAHPYPAPPGEPAYSGPTGTPPTSAELVAEFDKLEATSKQYRTDAAKVAFDQYKSGTLAPVFAMEAELMLLRSHLHELVFIYGEELSDH